MRLGFINGLRGIAITGVVFHHIFFTSFSYGIGHAMSVIDVIASSGWLGVYLFFFLSGFVLYLPYAAGERSFDSKSEIIDFYKRRFLRLYPLYIFVVIISLVFVYQGLDVNQWLLHFVFVTYPFQESTFIPLPNWVLWSIGIEMWFSIIFPWMVLQVNRFGFYRSFLLVIPLSLLVRIFGQEYYGTREAGGILNFVSDSVVGRLDDFLFGMYAAHIFLRESIKKYQVILVSSYLLGVLQ